jgi:NTE family protein
MLETNNGIMELKEPAPTSLLKPKKLEDGLGLSLSGGGYRAMLFHLGALYRLNELCLLPKIKRIASVSGGSLAAAALAIGWNDLKFDSEGIARNLTEAVGKPLLNLAERNIDIKAIALGLLPGLSAANIAAHYYDRFLCHGAKLQDLPASPKFVFIATNLQTGSIWRFSKEYAADYQVGQWFNPDLPLSTILSASAGFPPFLSPCRVRVPDGKIEKTDGATHNKYPFNRHLVLTDGGVYDNLGLEPVWKRYKTLLVSDGGALSGYQGRPSANWLSQSIRVNSIAMQQVIFLRKRFLRDVDSYKDRDVLVWSIAEPLKEQLLTFSSENAITAAAVPTRLAKLNSAGKRLLLQSGYVHCVNALESSTLNMKDKFPDFSVLPL